MEDPAAAAGADAPIEPVRSTGAVLGVLAAIVAIPLVAFAILALGGSGGAGEDVIDVLDSDVVYAVYLTNDLVYFGRPAASSGDFFELRDAYFLRRTEAAADAGEDDAPADVGETELVSVSQEVGGTGTLVVNAGEVVRIQPLAEDSEIARTLEAGDED